MYIVDVIWVNDDKPEHDGILIYKQQFFNIEMKRFVKELNGSYYVTVDPPEDGKSEET